ncbi:type II toxin-antitoxin system Phd/YefM family antitoxin [Rothia mucilaginosa]|uniref:type II toxin-antitoxin system Phd/YefM family antitoxin n=1 Tax=Rothia mucilaginosa TaxID=43675 RepID=UPI00066BC190|nr:type II toxin-antitoxin system Phd/YefM family antitoxin [Rothia mucilaginosa]
MTVMTSREFNQNLAKAQKQAQHSPVIITKRGEPTYVLMTYEEYSRSQQDESSLYDFFANYPQPDEGVDLPEDFPVAERSTHQRPVVEF